MPRGREDEHGGRPAKWPSGRGFAGQLGDLSWVARARVEVRAEKRVHRIVLQPPHAHWETVARTAPLRAVVLFRP